MGVAQLRTLSALSDADMGCSSSSTYHWLRVIEKFKRRITISSRCFSVYIHVLKYKYLKMHLRSITLAGWTTGDTRSYGGHFAILLLISFLQDLLIRDDGAKALAKTKPQQEFKSMSAFSFVRDVQNGDSAETRTAFSNFRREGSEIGL